ncbi:MAG: hypothetical protein MJZ74_10985, partial [Muribaculaceae bacterium]|nr:hypothetical protein [Muribaculaceae bacterium]
GGSSYGNNNGGNRPNGGSNYGNNNGGNRPNGGSNYGNNNGGNRPNGGSNYGNNNGGNRPNGGSNYGNHNGGNRPNGGSNYGNNGHRPNDNHGGYNNGGHRPDHNRGHNAYRDQYSWNHAHNNWSRPLPPPARAYRPAPYILHRPRIPVGYRPYYRAPIIDRILGITFGTMFNVSLNYLYTNGYTIDGYDNGTVYLRDVSMFSLLWPDVMLCYDNGRLVNAQFIHSTYYNDRSRYNRLYNDLCVTYGTPIEMDSGGVTWFGGNSVGYVTLSMTAQNGRYYTNLYIGN